MLATTGEGKRSMWASFFYELLRVDISVLADQQQTIYQLCVDAGYRLEDLPKSMADKDEYWDSR